MQDFGINLKRLQTSAKIALMISFGSSSCTSSLIPEPQVICAKKTLAVALAQQILSLNMQGESKVTVTYCFPSWCGQTMMT